MDGKYYLFTFNTDMLYVCVIQCIHIWWMSFTACKRRTNCARAFFLCIRRLRTLIWNNFILMTLIGFMALYVLNSINRMPSNLCRLRTNNQMCDPKKNDVVVIFKWSSCTLGRSNTWLYTCQIRYRTISSLSFFEFSLYLTFIVFSIMAFKTS